MTVNDKVDDCDEKGPDESRRVDDSGMDGMLTTCMSIYIKTRTCNCQKTLKNSRFRTRSSVIEAVNGSCNSVFSWYVWDSGFVLMIRDHDALERFEFDLDVSCNGQNARTRQSTER